MFNFSSPLTRPSGTFKGWLNYSFLRGLMKAAVILAIIISAGWATKKVFLTPESAEISLDGRYLGFIEIPGNNRQVAYLQISKTLENQNAYSISLIRSVVTGSVTEDIEIDMTAMRLHSASLGEGRFVRKRNGKIILEPTEQNSMLWYFER